VSAYGGVRALRVGDTVKMAFETFLDGVFGLPYVLFVASFATNAVNEIVAVASSLILGGVFFASAVAGYVTTEV